MGCDSKILSHASWFYYIHCYLNVNVLQACQDYVLKHGLTLDCETVSS